MKKLGIILGIITIIIVVIGVTLLTKNNQGQNTQVSLPEYNQYFWSKTCPRCANVAKFMDTWEGKDVFEMEKFEISESRENSLLLLDRGIKICKIPKDELGIPLLVTPEGKCFSGEEPIIEYLKNIE